MSVRAGVRKRLEEDLEQKRSLHQTDFVARSLKRRLKDQPKFDHAAPEKGPMVRSMLRDWAMGILNSRQIQEYSYTRKLNFGASSGKRVGPGKLAPRTTPCPKSSMSRKHVFFRMCFSQKIKTCFSQKTKAPARNADPRRTTFSGCVFPRKQEPLHGDPLIGPTRPLCQWRHENNLSSNVSIWLGRYASVAYYHQNARSLLFVSLL